MEKQLAEICHLGHFLQCGGTGFGIQRTCGHCEIHCLCRGICGAVFPLAHIDWKSEIIKKKVGKQLSLKKTVVFLFLDFLREIATAVIRRKHNKIRKPESFI